MEELIGTCHSERREGYANQVELRTSLRFIRNSFGGALQGNEAQIYIWELRLLLIS